ncbi:MAG: nitroreductase family protein [Mycobacteriales bacterium]
MDLLPLTAHELLTTTRGVRLRLDLDRDVPREVLLECVRDALQAPSGSNAWPMQFVLVTDRGQIDRLADIYRAVYEELYKGSAGYIGALDKGSAERNASQQRTARSADHLAENFHRVPAVAIACGAGDPGSIMPGMWSFMLAARLRGLGTAWTALHLVRAAETAEVLGLPQEVRIAAIAPVAYSLGTDFKPALRPEPEEVVHWDRW